ncbi:MAG: hypothetical protein ACI8RD_000151 [Bacillariaceae sp.]|jgi:hypothetical protein
MAFSYMCMVLTVLYAGFAALILTYATDIIDEHAIEERDDINNIMMTSTNRKTNNTVGHTFNVNSHTTGYDGYIGGDQNNHNAVGYDGYIGERFDVVGRSGHRPRNNNGPAGFVSPTAPNEIS